MFVYLVHPSKTHIPFLFLTFVSQMPPKRKRAEQECTLKTIPTFSHVIRQCLVEAYMYLKVQYDSGDYRYGSCRIGIEHIRYQCEVVCCVVGCRAMAQAGFRIVLQGSKWNGIRGQPVLSTFWLTYYRNPFDAPMTYYPICNDQLNEAKEIAKQYNQNKTLPLDLRTSNQAKIELARISSPFIPTVLVDLIASYCH
jgi:hypothetical protein